MPRVRLPGPYRVHFYSGDCQEPIHVHVVRDRSECKVWLDSHVAAFNHGFSTRELRRIVALVRDHSDTIRHAWLAPCSD